MLTIESCRPSASLEQPDVGARKHRWPMNQVVPYPLWLGHAGNVRDFRQLYDVGIQAVLHLAAEELPGQMPCGLTYCHVPLIDGAGNDPALLGLAVSTVATLLHRRLPTLVSCGAGTSRAPAIAATALAMIYGGCPRQWLNRLTEHCHLDVSPGLWADLAVLLEGR
jgi:hypothetical protein